MKITAHVPTQQYGFIEISGAPEDKKEIERLYNQYAENPIAFKSDSLEGFVKLTTFNNETVMYNDTLHEYRDMQGNTLLGGSTYASKFAKPFDAEVMVTKCAAAWKVPEQDIQDIWNMNRDTSNHLGSAIHLGLELAHKHAKVGKTIQENKKGQEDNYALPKNPIVRKAVVSFIKEFGVNAEPEVLVSNVAKGRAGQIDRLLIDGMKCRVQDFKTSDMDKEKMKTYQHQLSFYASMLTDAGYTVEGLDIFYYDGDNWTKKSLEVLEVEG